ncbi:hypothetical protein COU14_01945 [Candidatus Kaiserbacteria bacterium CG10_big_fil_rev_8_21_14_0_10_44_10]|uniref:Uncharacterized protein n=1 Tax=Candidatus Kaiserbacteria bacterium CG10_big_fil_rev_8_21_14_0_10_44_10 TaxID=1974606 RepID=A0A2H0UJN7_9BACT|nr:MAG: hypothetical protein COU14_01945 [Candidatus Kaiserbacteria bacterium CG10_big_fil_rev_8_21_14_0_10_44_10]
MSTAFELVYVFLDKYIIPVFFAFGLVYLVYGIIEYYITDRQDHGRDLFFKSVAWFVLALLVYAIVAFFGWISTVSFSPGSVNTPTMPSGGANVEQRESILEVPNTPTR